MISTNTAERQYLSLMQDILDYGDKKSDRTGTGTLEIFAPQPLVFDVGTSFPLLTTKFVHFKSIAAELMWFMHGRTDVQSLQSLGCSIWDEFADPDGSLGPVYGKQWRAVATPDGREIDQLRDSVAKLIDNPDCRRNIVMAWNVADLKDMNLPPCHMFYQFNVSSKGVVNMSMYQRSADWFLGVPFNIASYAALLRVVAHLAGLDPGTLTMNFGSAHLYLNHLKQAELQLTRDPYEPPRLDVESVADHAGSLVLDKGTYLLNGGPDSLDEFCVEHLTLQEYTHHPAIKGKVSV